MGTGTILTFYSFKGGVGRTFALANISVLLAQWGYKVLCIDWELEAPGLEQYFRPWIDAERLGLLDLIEKFISGDCKEWSNHASIVHVPENGDRLRIILAGENNDDYLTRVQRINWSSLYEEHNFGNFVEQLRDWWKENFDFILIDSRTGVTDIGGICTVQLPDMLVYVLATNQQNLNGIKTVMERIYAARDGLPYDRGSLLVLPVISRFDGREEYTAGRVWLDKMILALTPFYANWINQNVLPREIISRTIIPYLSIWSFGENLPVLDEEGTIPEDISYSLITITAVIGQKLTKTGLLKESRDNYVSTAIRAAAQGGRFEYDALITVGGAGRDLGDLLAKALQRRGVRVVTAAAQDLKFGVSADFEETLTNCQHFVPVFGDSQFEVYGNTQVEYFLKQAVSDRAERLIFPILLGNARVEELPALLRNSRIIRLTREGVIEAADQIWNVMSQTAQEGALPRIRPSRISRRTKFSVTQLVRSVVDPVFLGALVLALFAALGIDAASRDVITLPFWLRAYDGLSLPHFLGGANLGLSFEHISLIGVICYFWCRFSYAVTDEILTTPLFTWEQPVPYIINFLILGTLFIAILGSDHLVGAVAFAALGAAAMIWKLDKVSW